jgi:hypothetical protein
MKRERTSVWIDGIERHLEDLRANAYEGASGTDRQARYVAAFALLAPVAVDVLQQVNASLLRQTGEVSVRPPGPDGGGGSIRVMVADLAGALEVDESIHGRATPPGEHQRRLSAGLHAPSPRRWRTRQSACRVAERLADAGDVTGGRRATAPRPLGDRHRRGARPDLSVELENYSAVGASRGNEGFHAEGEEGVYHRFTIMLNSGRSNPYIRTPTRSIDRSYRPMHMYQGAW